MHREQYAFRKKSSIAFATKGLLLTNQRKNTSEYSIILIENRHEKSFGHHIKTEINVTSNILSNKAKHYGPKIW